MQEEGLDCLIINGSTSLAAAIRARLTPSIYQIMPGSGRPTWYFRQRLRLLHIGMPLHAQNARDISPIQDVRAGVELEATVSARLKELGLEKGRIGIVGPAVNYFLPITIPYEHYKRFLEDFPEAEFLDVSEWYECIRSVKSEEEIALIERAAALNDLCHEAVVHATRPGMSHADLRRVAEQVAFMHKGNLCMMHLSSWPMSNQSWPYPDFWPTNRTVEEGHLIMTELPVGYGMEHARNSMLHALLGLRFIKNSPVYPIDSLEC